MNDRCSSLDHCPGYSDLGLSRTSRTSRIAHHSTRHSSSQSSSLPRWWFAPLSAAKAIRDQRRVCDSRSSRDAPLYIILLGFHLSRLCIADNVSSRTVELLEIMSAVALLPPRARCVCGVGSKSCRQFFKTNYTVERWPFASRMSENEDMSNRGGVMCRIKVITGPGLPKHYPQR